MAHSSPLLENLVYPSTERHIVYLSWQKYISCISLKRGDLIHIRNKKVSHIPILRISLNRKRSHISLLIERYLLFFTRRYHTSLSNTNISHISLNRERSRIYLSWPRDVLYISLDKEISRISFLIDDWSLFTMVYTISSILFGCEDCSIKEWRMSIFIKIYSLACYVLLIVYI